MKPAGATFMTSRIDARFFWPSTRDKSAHSPAVSSKGSVTASSSPRGGDEIEGIVFLIRDVVEAQNADGDEAEHDAAGFEDIGLEDVDDVSDRSLTVH